MDVETLAVDREKARELWQKYLTHREYQTPVDFQIQRAYEQIAKGKTLIRAVASIVNAGLGEDGFPKLAIGRADAASVGFRFEGDNSSWGSFSTASENSWYWRRKNAHWSTYTDIPRGSFPTVHNRKRHRATAVMPLIPVHLRPKRGLQNYFTLFEAEWSHIVPVDPMLLRKLNGDIWVVVCAWNLTPVERAAMENNRLST